MNARIKLKLRRRALFIQLVSLLIVVVVGGWLLTSRLDAPEAEAAPAKKTAPIEDAAAPIVDARLDDDAGEAGAIDLAIAPDGGVPFHPSGTKYRSPFAKPNGTPVRVKVAMLLNSVDEYDVKTGLFDADFFISLTSPSPMPAMSLQYPNGETSSSETLADKPTFKLFRVKGKFKSPPDLRKYPFDAQSVKIFVEDDLHGIDQVRFQVDKDRAQLARGFRALGWSVTYVEARTYSHTYPERFEGDDLYYGRYTFELGLQRYSTSAAFKVYVPALVIVIISLLGMWVPADEMEVRSNSGAPMLAGAVLFHFALMQELPATSYLTRADQLMLGVYLSLLLGMISTWFMFLVHHDNVERVFKISRVVVPCLSVAVMAIAIFL